MNITAMLKTDNGTSIKRVRTSQEIQQELRDYIFSPLRNYLNCERIRFTGEFKPDDGQVLMIENFEPPFNTSFISNILELESLHVDEIQNIYGLIFSEPERNEIVFQAFDSRKILGNREKFELVHDKNNFSKFNKKGIVIDQRIDGIYLRRERILLFKSFHTISRLFDIRDYYREATDREIQDFGNNNLIQIDNMEDFLRIADTQIRKHIFLIQKNGVLTNLQEKDRFIRAKEFADKFGIGNLFNENDQKILIPARDKKRTKQLLKFLNDDLYESPLSDNKYETNSKRRIS